MNIQLPSRFAFFLTLFFLVFVNSFGQASVEYPLWAQGIENNPVQYPEERLRTVEVRASSLSQQNKVYSCVFNPVYTLVKPENPNGVGIVICPGGGFRDVWFDREGTDLALFLAKHGITSMVLKYRTFNTGEITTSLKYEEYIYHVYADAKQALNLLHKQAKELGLDTLKIGIGGFSAGGALAIGTAIEMGDDKLPEYANSLKLKNLPDFACLIYPGIHPDFIKKAEVQNTIPPIFMINGNEDKVTPATSCIDLYSVLKKRNIKTEMHIYAKGGHGFDSGMERGNGIATWRDSFIAWLKDMEFMK